MGNTLSRGTIESAAAGNKLALRDVLLQMLATHQQVLGSLGQNFPESSNSAQPSSSKPPAQPQIDVLGANGTYTVHITPGGQGISSQVFFEVSYSTVSTFTSNVTVLPLSTTTTLTVPAPGQDLYWRVRASFDKSTWTSYAFSNAGKIVSSGLQSSDATAPAVPLNITNYANVDSVDNGSGSANIRIYGNGGPGTSWIGVKGGKEQIFPSATIIGADFGSDQFTGFDNDAAQYLVKSTLPEVFPDSVTPAGKVAVVGGGLVEEPVVELVLDSDHHVIAWNVIDQGNGLTGDVTLTINTILGSGATPGQQTRSGGKLISIAPGNPGQNYQSSDTVSVSGGTFEGQPGGGTITGSNGGRLTAV